MGEGLKVERKIMIKKKIRLTVFEIIIKRSIKICKMYD